MPKDVKLKGVTDIAIPSGERERKTNGTSTRSERPKIRMSTSRLFEGPGTHSCRMSPWLSRLPLRRVTVL